MPEEMKNNVTPFFSYSAQNDIFEENGLALESIVTSRQKHKDKLLTILYERKYCSHTELAERLNISASGLNATIKKVNEVDNPPIKFTKTGKFKYYSLTQAGLTYVENVLLVSLDRKSTDHLREVWRILQDKAGDLWEVRFRELFSVLGKTAEDAEDEEEAAFLEFMDSFAAFYDADSREAASFIEELTGSSWIRYNVLAYAAKTTGDNNKLAGLNHLLRKNCVMAYRLLDDLFDAAISLDEPLLMKKYELRDATAFREMVREIESDILHALMTNADKSALSSKWIHYGMDQQMAYYAAEKYRVLKDKIKLQK